MSQFPPLSRNIWKAQRQQVGVLMRKHWFSTGNGTEEIKCFFHQRCLHVPSHTTKFFYTAKHFIYQQESRLLIYTSVLNHPTTTPNKTTANNYYYKIQQQTWYSRLQTSSIWNCFLQEHTGMRIVRVIKTCHGNEPVVQRARESLCVSQTFLKTT